MKGTVLAAKAAETHGKRCTGSAGGWEGLKSARRQAGHGEAVQQAATQQQTATQQAGTQQAARAVAHRAEREPNGVDQPGQHRPQARVAAAAGWPRRCARLAERGQPVSPGTHSQVTPAHATHPGWYLEFESRGVYLRSAQRSRQPNSAGSSKASRSSSAICCRRRGNTLNNVRRSSRVWW